MATKQTIERSERKTRARSEYLVARSERQLTCRDVQELMGGSMKNAMEARDEFEREYLDRVELEAALPEAEWDEFKTFVTRLSVRAKQRAEAELALLKMERERERKAHVAELSEIAALNDGLNAQIMDLRQQHSVLGQQAKVATAAERASFEQNVRLEAENSLLKEKLVQAESAGSIATAAEALRKMLTQGDSADRSEIEVEIPTSGKGGRGAKRPQTVARRQTQSKATAEKS